MIILSLSSFWLNFGAVPTVWYFLLFISFSIFCVTGCFVYNFCDWILELFWQCGIFCFSYHFLHAVLLAVLSTNFAIEFWNCSDSVVFFVFHFIFYTLCYWLFCLQFLRFIFELFRQCGIFCFSYHFLYSVLLAVLFTMFAIEFWSCSDSVVFVAFHIIFYILCYWLFCLQFLRLKFETVPTVWYFLFFLSFPVLYVTGYRWYCFLK